MVDSQYSFNTLLLCSLISFAVFGSLSHIFTFSLVIVFIINFLKSKDKRIHKKNVVLSILLGCVFFVFLFRGAFHTNFWATVEALSPMTSIPIISLLILFQDQNKFVLTKSKLSEYSQIAIVFVIIVFLALNLFFWPKEYFLVAKSARLELFSGNPIPFSTVTLGISLFCLSNWNASNTIRKIIAFILFSLGIYFAGYLSGTRTTMLSILFLVPLVLWHLSNSKLITFTTTAFLFVSGTTFLSIYSNSSLEVILLERFNQGILEIYNFKVAEKWNDSSLSLRLAIWKSAFYTVLENPLFGYGPSERFTAVVPILSIDHLSFTHPHNDIVAGAVSVGLLGIPLVFASILSPVWAALFSEHLTKNKLFLGISLSICVFMTANINTILFNDISAAWLSFSTFLILKLKN